MAKFDPANADYAPGFIPNNLVVVGHKASRGELAPVVVYSNEFKNKTYFHIRELWFNDQNDTWNVGKGISMPAENALSIFAAIGKLAAPVASAPKAAPRKIKTA